jgi:hypothetical protein
MFSVDPCVPLVVAAVNPRKTSAKGELQQAMGRVLAQSSNVKVVPEMVLPDPTLLVQAVQSLLFAFPHSRPEFAGEKKFVTGISVTPGLERMSIEDVSHHTGPAGWCTPAKTYSVKWHMWLPGNSAAQSACILSRPPTPPVVEVE